MWSLCVKQQSLACKNRKMLIRTFIKLEIEIGTVYTCMNS